MSYWRFVSILETASTQGKRQSGKLVTRSKIYQSQKDMIERTKEMMKKNG